MKEEPKVKIWAKESRLRTWGRGLLRPDTNNMMRAFTLITLSLGPYYLYSNWGDINPLLKWGIGLMIGNELLCHISGALSEKREWRWVTLPEKKFLKRYAKYLEKRNKKVEEKRVLNAQYASEVEELRDKVNLLRQAFKEPRKTEEAIAKLKQELVAEEKIYEQLGEVSLKENGFPRDPSKILASHHTPEETTRIPEQPASPDIARTPSPRIKA